MHGNAMNWVSHVLAENGERVVVDVLDIGGRNMNGSARDLFPRSKYVSLDIAAGDGVDVVADATTWRPIDKFDVVVCLNVFEHLRDWRGMISTAFYVLRPGGLFICSAAGPGYAPHSGRSALHAIEPDEWYENVSLADLLEAMYACGFRNVNIASSEAVPRRPSRVKRPCFSTIGPCDSQGWAVKPL